MYDLGIIGGMGPESTDELLRRIIAFTDAKCDQDHISICILNIPQTPDRSNAILHGGPSPLPFLRKAVDDLISLNVKRYIIACNTAHYFARELRDERIEFIDIIASAAQFIKDHNINPIALFGTAGGLKVYEQVFLSEGITLLPYEDRIRAEITDIIYDIKQTGANRNHGRRMKLILEHFCSDQIKTYFLLGCTELSLLKPYIVNDFAIIDALDIAAISAIKKCGYKLKDSINLL